MYRINQIRTAKFDCYSSIRFAKQPKNRYFDNIKFDIQDIETNEHCIVYTSELYELAKSGMITFTTVYNNDLCCTLSSLRASLLYNSVALVDYISCNSLVSKLPDSRLEDYQVFMGFSEALIKEHKNIGRACKFDQLKGLDFSATSMFERRIPSSNGIYLGYRCDGTVVDADTRKTGNDFIADTFNVLYNVIDYYFTFPHRFFMYDNNLYIPANKTKLFVFKLNKYFIMEML